METEPNMSPNILGFVKTSLVDYPNKVASVIFLGGCNFKCKFCHNPELIANKTINSIDIDGVFAYLEKRKDVIDGVCVTGGEPTVTKGLVNFVEKIKKLGYPIKLDTNGTNPVMLEKMLDQNLIDYVAMDIKMPLDETYKGLIATQFDPTPNIKKSLHLLEKTQTPYELRTTVIPNIHTPEVMTATVSSVDALIDGKSMHGWYLQAFRPGGCLEKEFDTFEPCSKQYLESLYILLTTLNSKISLR